MGFDQDGVALHDEAAGGRQHDDVARNKFNRRDFRFWSKKEKGEFWNQGILTKGDGSVQWRSMY
jgi:hypothetical protein